MKERMNHIKVLKNNNYLNEYILCWRSIAVPGEIHGLWTAFETFGSGIVSWSALIEPTINLMNIGYPVSEALAKAIRGRNTSIINVNNSLI